LKARERRERGREKGGEETEMDLHAGVGRERRGREEKERETGILAAAR